MLRRGDYVIMNDVDCPEAKLVAVLSRYDDSCGIWHAVYLCSLTSMARPCGRQPTLLSAFGKRVEWDWGGKLYRVADADASHTATYRDGRPRPWQDRSGREWWPCRKLARNAVSAWAASETV